MLKGIDPLLTPELLKTLAEMGHGDEIVIADANFTAAYDHDLAEIQMLDGAGRELVVVFHKIYGRRATFVVDQRARKVVDQFGEDAAGYAAMFDRPLNFFGV